MKAKDSKSVLQAKKGKYLTNGKIYVKKVYVGKNDNPLNWKEVDAPKKDKE